MNSLQGFLVESKLLKLLAPLEKDDQSLMKLDAIFAALHVENEDDIYRLATYFSIQNPASTAAPGEQPVSAQAGETTSAAKEENTHEVS